MLKALLVGTTLAATAIVPATASAGGPLPPVAPVGSYSCGGSVKLAYANGNVTANLLGYCSRNVKMSVWLESNGVRSNQIDQTTSGFNRTSTAFAGATGTPWKACGKIDGKTGCTQTWVK